MFDEVAPAFKHNLPEFIFRYMTHMQHVCTLCRDVGCSFAEAQRRSKQDLFSFLRSHVIDKQPKPPKQQQIKRKAGETPHIASPGDGKKMQDFPGFIQGLRCFGGKSECSAIDKTECAAQRFCTFYLDARGCNKGTACAHLHKCDIKLPSDKTGKTLCLQAHTRKEHVDTLGLPQY